MITVELGPLRRRDFRWFFVATSLNRLGSMMTPVAYAFAVLEVSNSARALAQVLGVEVLANAIFVLFGGIVADRFSRRLVMQATYVCSAAALVGTAALLLSGQASVSGLTVLAALTGAVSAFALPAAQGIVPELVSRADLQQANALISLVRNTAQILGPVVAGVFFAAGGAPWALLIDAGAYLAASVFLSRVHLPGRGTADASVVRELREGWTEFRSRTWLWVVVAASCLLNAIIGGALMILGPLVAKNTPALGVSGWGWVLGAQGAGTLLGAVLLLRVPLERPLRSGVGALSTVAVLLIGLGIYPETVPLMAAAVLAGIGLEVFGTSWNVVFQERIPLDVLARVSSYDLVGSLIAIPVGMVAYGALATTLPTSTLLISSGLAFAVVCLATLTVPSVRNMARIGDHATTS